MNSFLYPSTMIIDFHSHIFPPSFHREREEYVKRDATFADLFSDPRSKLATADDLIVAMDEAEVDVAIVMGVGWMDLRMAMEANDYILESAARFPSRLVGFCSVNPAWGDGAISEVERCADGGIKGIGELHPDTQGFDVVDQATMAPIMDEARRLGLVVLIHSSEPLGHCYSGKGNVTPDKLWALARNFPQDTIVCAHWGGGLPFYSLMPEVAEETKNVYFDTAASPFLYKQDIFSAVVGINGSDRILFGTDFPLVNHPRLLKQIEEAAITPEARTDITSGNARRILGL